VGILIEPLSWNLMAAKVAAHKPGISLDRVQNHSKVEILTVPNDVEHVRLLAQLGIREHAFGQVRAAAPMGGPILLEIGGSSVAIARAVARKIRVRVI
jgi:Fe2+ transport system protein FeoA